MSVAEIAYPDPISNNRIGLIEVERAEDFRLAEDDVCNYGNNFQPRFDDLYQGYETAANFYGHTCLLTCEQQLDGSVVRSLLFHLRGSQAYEAICFIETTGRSVYVESHIYSGSRIISGPITPLHQLVELLLTDTKKLVVHRPFTLAG